MMLEIKKFINICLIPLSCVLFSSFAYTETVVLPEYCDDCSKPESSDPDLIEKALFLNVLKAESLGSSFGKIIEADSDEIRDILGNEIESLVKTNLQTIALNAAEQLLPGLGSFLKGAIGGSSNSTAALIQQQTEIILKALDDLESNIKDQINFVATEQIRADFEGLKLTARDYFSFQTYDEKVAVNSTLVDMFTNISEVRQLFEAEFVEKYDFFHIYLDVVALEFMIVTEYFTMAKLIAGTGDSDSEIEEAVRNSIDNRLDQVLSHVEDFDWEAKSNSRFTNPERERANLGYSDMFADVVEDAKEQGLLDLDIDLYDIFWSGIPNEYWQISTYEVTYLVEGEMFTAEVYTASDFVAFSETVQWTRNYNGELVHFAASGIGDSLLSLDDQTKFAVESHMERDEVVTTFLARAYLPARYILQGWWELAGREGDLPENEWDVMLGDLELNIDDPDLGLGTGFEFGLGIGWSNTGAYEWTINSGSTPSGSTGPSSGYGGSLNYAYLETSSGHAFLSGNTAILESAEFESESYVVTFNYHMYGLDTGTLYLERFDTASGQWIELWSQTGQVQTSSSEAWKTQSVTVESEGIHKIRFRAVAAGNYRGDIAIDEIEIRLSEELPSVNFENGLAWENTGDFNWFVDSAGTPSNDTGPNTGANDTEFYAYFETSSGFAFANGDTAILESPEFYAEGSHSIEYSIHAYGLDLGTLYVEIYDEDSNSWDSINSIFVGTQFSSDDPWLDINSNYNFSGSHKIRFRAVAQGGWRGDFAIDEISVYKNP